MIDSQSTLVEYLQKDILRLIGYVAVGGLLGWFFGFFGDGLLLGITLFLLMQMRALYSLYRWLRFFPNNEPPELSGIWAAIIYNIKRAQIKEQRAQDGLRSVIIHAQTSISALEEAVVLIEGDTMLEWWNPSAEKMLGLVNGDKGRNICNLIRTPDFLKYFQQTSHTEGARLRSWVKPNHYLQCKITKFGDNSRLMFVQDVTHLHQLEQIRKDFVANVSHELRTPLTVLSGYLEMMVDSEELAPKWQPVLTQMTQQSTRMSLLIHDLLHLSRLESSPSVTDKKTINMKELFIRLEQDAKAYNQPFEHKIVFNLLSEKTILGSEKELTSAFMNLIINAIKYTPKKGEVTVTWRDDGKFAYFSVADTGIGIDSGHIPRLTERFYRVDKGRSLATGGTGLGLAIVKHILMRHDAHLDITSTANVGSVFSCVFPWSQML